MNGCKCGYGRKGTGATGARAGHACTRETAASGGAVFGGASYGVRASIFLISAVHSAASGEVRSESYAPVLPRVRRPRRDDDVRARRLDDCRHYSSGFGCVSAAGAVQCVPIFRYSMLRTAAVETQNRRDRRALAQVGSRYDWRQWLLKNRQITKRE